jgi:hypothetical protein
MATKKDPYVLGRPMTRNEITQHAAVVVSHLQAETHRGRGLGSDNITIYAFQLQSIIELALCRAAGIPWERKTAKARPRRTG